MKNLKKLAAATAVAALAAVPAVAGTPAAELPGANVGFAISVALAKEQAGRLTRNQLAVARDTAVLTVSGAYVGLREGGLVGTIVGAA